MILLDTNVLSELMRPIPEPRVVEWIDSFLEWDVWISAITVAEIRIGIELLDDGNRKFELVDLAEQMFHEEFQDRCLPFDFQAALEFAMIVSGRNRIGRPISVEDAQIASIAKTADLTLATRNTKDFINISGLLVVNPWEKGPRITE